MLLNDLEAVIENSKSILKKIKGKYPSIRVHLVLSTPYSIVPIDTNITTLLDECEDFFIETEVLKTVWNLLDDMWEINEETVEKRRHKKSSPTRDLERKYSALQERYNELLGLIEVHNSICVDLRWDDIDYNINNLLRSDIELVDVSRTPQLGGIRICLGNLSKLISGVP